MNKIARIVISRSKLIVFLWLLVLAVTSLLSIQKGSDFTDSLSLPMSESQKAADLLISAHSVVGLNSMQIVFSSTDNLPLNQTELQMVISAVGNLSFVDSISSPFDPGSQAVSKDGFFNGKPQRVKS